MGKDDLYKKIEKKSGVNMNEIFQLAGSIQGANLQDERTIRQIIRRVAVIANRKVSKEKEDELVKVILKNPGSINFQNITKMMGKS